MEISIDTLKIYERLKKVNIEDRAAKEISEILRENAHEIASRQEAILATKHDIARIEAVMATKQDIAETKTEIIKWVAGMLVAQAAVVATLVKLL